MAADDRMIGTLRFRVEAEQPARSDGVDQAAQQDTPAQKDVPVKGDQPSADQAGKQETGEEATGQRESGAPAVR